MRALVILVWLAGAAAAAPRTTALGFDHNVHSRDLAVNAKEEPACTSCHAMEKGKLVGRPDHGSCFGACHGATPAKPKRGGKIELGDRAKVCESCHAEATLAAPFTGKLTVGYPPYTIDRDFNLSFGHKQHQTAACELCHAPDTKKTYAPHDRCVSCHLKTMNKCADCHPAATGKPQPPELKALHDTVAATFSHPVHAARGRKGKECVTCHAAIRTTDDSELPRPKVADCGVAGCHDGKAAFATTGPCVRCHDKPDVTFTVERPTERFQHSRGKHGEIVTGEACTACHVIKGGEIISAGHAACAVSGCHADDFGLRKPTICGACHNATEPWRHLVPDRSPPERTEFGATLDHAQHTGACASCHSLRTASQQLRPPRGHRACSGCHRANEGPAPHLGECAGCHALGENAAREAVRAKDPWSVRLAFDHAPHAKDTTCATCHIDLTGKNVLALPAPPKSTCASCHDGTRAFSLSGTGCRKCHASEAPK